MIGVTLVETNSAQLQLHNFRNSSLETLRLIAMAIIIFHHFVVHGIFPAVDIHQHHTLGVLISLLAGWGGYMGNSLFILLTGYFSVRKKLSVKRLVMLLGAMVFYSVVIALVWKNQHRLPPEEMKKVLFPFWYGYNWFVACYLLFMPLTPFLNRLLRQLSKVQYLGLVILEYFLYCVMPAFHGDSFSNAPMLQFVMMYCIGGYLQLHGFKQEKLHKAGNWVLLTVVLVLLTDVAVVRQWLKGYDIWRFVNLLSTGTAIALFMAVVCHKPFTNTKINQLAGSVLGVYLIHDNPLVRPFLWRELLPNVDYLDKGYFVLFMVAKVAAVYTVCLGIDLARRQWLEPIFQHWVDQHWDGWCNMSSRISAWIEKQVLKL